MSTTFSLIVHSPPFVQQGAHTALRFANAVVAQGHSLARVFFYGDGVYNANALLCPPEDELNLMQQWQALKASSQCELLVCVAAALRRGIMDTDEAQRYGQDHANLAPGFELTGLGQWQECYLAGHKVIEFKGGV